MINNERLKGIRSRISKITKGEWKIEAYKSGWCLKGGLHTIVTFFQKDDSDMNFFLHAPADIEFLANEVERLEKERKEAYSSGFAMAKFDCAMDLESGAYSNKELYNRWHKVIENIDNQKTS